MKGGWNWFWKGGSILLLAYVIVRGFFTPLQPGLVSATPSQLSVRPQVCDPHSRRPTFCDPEDLPEPFEVVLRSGDQLIRTEVLDSLAAQRAHLAIDVPPPCLPGRWTLTCLRLLREPSFWAMPALLKTPPKAMSPQHSAPAAPHPQDPELGFSFPYQPNIMESIRNLLWHVPMWFAMFFIMGLGFVASLAQLRTDSIQLGHARRSCCQNRPCLRTARTGHRFPLGPLDLGGLVGF